MYEFSWGWFFIGFLIVVGGVVFVRFHQWAADNFGGGVSSYDRFKLWAVITCIVGVLVMLNLHTFILKSLLSNLFPH